MSKFSNAVTKHRKIVLTVFFALSILGLIVSNLVTVNYNMVDYLPETAQSTVALDVMIEEFGGELPNARVMLSGVSVGEALDYADSIAALDGVSSVSWLDDVVGRATLTSSPLEFLDKAVLETYYKDGSALISVTIENGAEKDTVHAIRELIGEDNAVAGEAVDIASAQEMSVSEVAKAMGLLIPAILIILLLTTTSWIEPLLFLTSIGIAVLINMGTNVFFGEVSFITQTVSPILQLAVSLDYAIFLLHSFNDFRKEHEPAEAMKLAMKKSLSAIAASAATTVFGFLALMFMRFGIGSDLGLNLVKGVLISFVSVMTFLPALTLASYRIIDKTKHRSFIPSFKGAGKWLLRISVPFMIAAFVVVVPVFLAQSKTDFIYGAGGVAAQSRAGIDAEAIEARFGKENVLVLLVPVGDTGREKELCDALRDIPMVKSVMSYVSTVGSAIPPEYLDENVTQQFYSENYARIILYTNMDSEGDDAFQTVQTVLDTVPIYYDTFYMTGRSASLFDMKTTVSVDTGIVNLCAIIGIFLVLLITYRSVSLPIFLLFTIETAIWINLSFAYFSDQSFSFIGYLIISTVQLGSTVDYAILLTDRYLGNRRELGKKEAMRMAISENIVAILTSAAILSIAGFALALTSTNVIIAELGTLLGRGTLLSLLMVTCVLPALLVVFDKLFQKTTLRDGFFKRRAKSETSDIH